MADAALRHARDEGLGIDLEGDCVIELLAKIGKHAIEGDGLGRSARKAVEQERCLGIGLELLLDQADDNLVGTSSPASM